MSVGAGNTVVTLVATADSEGVVKGEGPIDADFLRAVGEGRKIAVNYGYQNVGPYNGPPPAGGGGGGRGGGGLPPPPPPGGGGGGGRGEGARG